MLDKCQHVSALSYFNQAIIRSNIVAKEEHTEHIMLCKGKGLPQQAWTGLLWETFIGLVKIREG